MLNYFVEEPYSYSLAPCESKPPPLDPPIPKFLCSSIISLFYDEIDLSGMLRDSHYLIFYGQPNHNLSGS